MTKVLVLLILSLQTFSMEYHPLRNELYQHVITHKSRHIYMTITPSFASKGSGEEETKGSYTVSLKDRQLRIRNNDCSDEGMLVSPDDVSLNLVDPDCRFSLSDSGHILLVSNRAKIVAFNTETKRSLFTMKNFGGPVRDMYIRGNRLTVHSTESEGNCIDNWYFDLKLRHDIRHFFKRQFTQRHERLLDLIHNCMTNDFQVPLTDHELVIFYDLFHYYERLIQLMKNWITNL